MNYKTVVRVVLTHGDDSGVPNISTAWLDMFERAGLVQFHRDNDEGICFDVLPPADVAAYTTTASVVAWARMTAERMQSFGVNAVAAPPWDRTTNGPRHHA